MVKIKIVSGKIISKIKGDLLSFVAISTFSFAIGVIATTGVNIASIPTLHTRVNAIEEGLDYYMTKDDYKTLTEQITRNTKGIEAIYEYLTGVEIKF